MPIPFASVPFHLKMMTLQKLELKDFTALQQSNLKANALSTQMKSYFTIPQKLCGTVSVSFKNEKMLFTFNEGSEIDLEGTPLRFDSTMFLIQSKIGDKFCRLLLQYFNKTGSSVELLALGRDSGIDKNCSPVIFHQFLESANVKQLGIDQPTEAKYFRSLPDSIKKMWINSKIEDEDFMNLTGINFVWIQKCRVSSLTLNAFLKEWLERKRSFTVLMLTTDKPLRKEDVLRGIPHSAEKEVDTFKIVNGEDLLVVSIHENAGAIYACDVKAYGRSGSTDLKQFSK